MFITPPRHNNACATRFRFVGLKADACLVQSQLQAITGEIFIALRLRSIQTNQINQRLKTRRLKFLQIQLPGRPGLDKTET